MELRCAKDGEILIKAPEIYTEEVLECPICHFGVMIMKEDKKD